MRVRAVFFFCATILFVFEQNYEPVAKAQLKKQVKLYTTKKRKDDAKKIQEQEDAIKREKNMEEAKQIAIEEDKSLPAAKIVITIVVISKWFHYSLN